MRRTLTLLLVLAVAFALRRSGGGDGGGDGPSNRPGDGGDGTGSGRPSQSHGNINAGQGTGSAQDAVQAEFDQGRSQQSSAVPDTPSTLDRYNSNGDPMAELGPGRQTNPAEWDNLVSEAEALGVEVRYREGGIFYAPGLSRGQPGQITIDPNASYSALMHEMSHVRDDHNAGWRGFEGVYDRDFLADSERSAYQVEIDYANELGRTDLAAELTQLRDDRIAEIYGEDG